MLTIFKVVRDIAFFLSSVRTIVDVADEILGDDEAPEQQLSVNNKVEAILETDGLISNPVDAAEEQYISTVRDGLERSKVDPQMAAFAVDLMRVCPSARQYRIAQRGRKKVINQADVTSEPWVRFKREVFIREDDELEEMTSLVVYIQKGQVEPLAIATESGGVANALFFFGANEHRYIVKRFPSLGAMSVMKEWTTVSNLFAQAAQRPEYQQGRRVPVRMVISRRPYRTHQTVRDHQYAEV